MEEYFKSVDDYFKDKPTENLHNCIVCGRMMAIKYEVPNYVKCLDCGFIWRSPRPTKKVLDEFYKESKPMSSWAAIKKTFKEYFRQKSKFSGFIKYIKKNQIKSVLDYGCGTCFFLDQLSSNICKFGYDPNAASLQGVSKDITLIGDLKNITKYDMITMFGVLEHLYDVESIMEKICQCTDAIGIIVPNSRSAVIEHLKDKCCTFVPQHLWFFNIHNLYKFMRMRGFILQDYWTIESEAQPVANALAGMNPYADPVYKKDLEKHILKTRKGYKICAIFRKCSRKENI